jgi:hypothetical protein
VSIQVVGVEGDARRRGEVIGSELARPIHRSLSFYRRFVERHGLDPARLPEILGPYREAAEAAFPALVEELDATARGAEASSWELFAVNAFEELEPMPLGAPARAERCTAFAVDGPDGPIVGHNEQWYAGDVGNVAVVIGRPDEGVAFASPTVVTCLPAVGLNAAGVAQAIMSLVADDDGVGIPRVLVSRHALQATSPEDAVRRATPRGRAGGYAHLFAFPDGETLTVEAAAARHAVVRDPVHTNHYLDADLAASAPEPTSSSAARLERANSLFAEERPATAQRAMEVLADHHGGADAICAHPRAGDGDEAMAIVFSMVCDLGRGRMWVAPGQPCETPFEEIDLGEIPA